MLGFLYDAFKFLLLLILPFAILIRGASHFHIEFGWSPLFCLGLAAGCTAAIMFIYFSFFYGKLTGKLGSFNALKWRALIAFLFVAVYLLHGILFFSGTNMKNPALKQEMRELHPIVRLSLSTLIHLDKDLIITDASRVPEDYKSMGLATKSKSLHYKQASTNYVHAVDIRTKGRNEIKNTLVNIYFKLMGFNTLRHTGTADHLHVSLMSHDAPYAK